MILNSQFELEFSIRFFASTNSNSVNTAKVLELFDRLFRGFEHNMTDDAIIRRTNFIFEFCNIFELYYKKFF